MNDQGRLCCLWMTRQPYLFLSLFFLSFLDRWRWRWRWKGLEMDDALPQKRWKKELYTYLYLYFYLYLYLSVLFLANQLNTNMSCHHHHHHHHQGCVNEVMIEFFRSHFCCWWVSLLHTVDLTCFIPSSFTHQRRSSDLNEYIRYKSTIVWSYYLQQVPQLIYLPYLTLPHTTYLTDLVTGTGTGSFNSSSIKENPHDRQQSEHGHVIPSISIEKTPFSFTFVIFLNFFRFFDFL